MVNEEDHLRVQFMFSGFRLPEVWDAVNQLDDQLEEQLAYAFSPQLGYLTACPTNVGTGIRVGVMLHLPGLVQTKQIDKVFRALQKINLAVRGLYGEGSQASGDFYQISNQQTLGKSEPELIKILTDVVPQVLQYERTARQTLLTERRQHLHDQVSRAYGVLKTAQTISSEETMLLLSSVRMGINLGLIDDLSIATVNELFIQTQPAFLQKLRGSELGVEERNVARASYLRSRLSNGRQAPQTLSDVTGSLQLPNAIPERAARLVAIQLRDRSAQGARRDPQATLEEIRDAYEQKAKRYHPDAGGEEWVFRILVQAYEMLSSARVARATARRCARAQPAAHAATPDPSAAQESVHAGIHDNGCRPFAHRRRRAALRALSLGRCRVSLAHPARTRRRSLPELQPESQLAGPDCDRTRRDRSAITRRPSRTARGLRPHDHHHASRSPRGRATTTIGSPAGSSIRASIAPGKRSTRCTSS